MPGDLVIAKVRCPGCESTLPPTEFQRCSRNKNGLQVYCKSCMKRRKHEEWKARHPDAHKPIRLEDGRRWCPECEEYRTPEAFYRSAQRPDGMSTYCRSCTKKRYEVQREAQGLSPRKPAQSPEIRKKKWQEYIRKTIAQQRAEMIAAYGGACQCCGEREPQFLSIDHINGGGSRHRRELKRTGYRFYAWLKQQGYPRDAYRLLCMNCNHATGRLGYCPHQKVAVQVETGGA